MKTLHFIAVLLLVITNSSQAQYEERNKLLDAFLRQGIQDWNVPGLAAVVVKDGKVVFQKVYGLKNITTKDTVNAQTLFPMASTTKALTAIALGILVDKNKIEWEDKVVKHIPEFALSDSFVTQNVRILDLLTHNVGIKNTDKIWVWDSTSTSEMMKRYSHAPMEYPLRGGFSYQNLMYIIASEVITRASGMHWQTFVEKNIFEPLGMRHSATNAKAILKHGNYSNAHIDHYEKGVVVLPLNCAEQVGGAGGLWSSAEDMGKYLQFLIGRGEYNDKQILKKATFDYLFSPKVIIPNSSNSMFKVIDTNWQSYGLGWFQHDYKGEKLDYHTGSLAGSNAIAGVMHSKKTALYLFANISDAAMRQAFLYKAIDMYGFNDLAGRDWNATVRKLYGGGKENAKEAAEKREDSRKEGTSPKHPLQNYVGTYSHEMFGDVNITLKDKTLQLDHNRVVFYSLSHWQYETFISSPNAQWLYKITVKFRTNDEGNVYGIYYDDPNINVEFVKTEK